jgi:hypothetical protein
MRGDLRRGLVAGALALAAALLIVGTALGGTLSAGDDQVVDVSKQLSGLQKKLDELQSKGRSARQGKLAAAADCGFGAPSQVFGAWGDDADYSLIPEGDLSSIDGWSLKNVAVTPESDPFTGGTRSLLFTKGDSEAVTPVMCVNLEHPTLRMFLADRGGNGKAHVEVKVLYEGLDGHSHDLTVARLKVGDRWEPSVIVPVGVNMLSVASANGWTPVAIDLKVHGLQKGETFSVAGIYVDPCHSR